MFACLCVGECSTYNVPACIGVCNQVHVDLSNRVCAHVIVHVCMYLPKCMCMNAFVRVCACTCARS